MFLSSNDVIIANATVIVGLLILLSFQSTGSSMSISVKMTDVLERLEELQNESDNLQALVKAYQVILGDRTPPDVLERLKSTLPPSEFNKILEKQTDPEKAKLIELDLPKLELKLIELEAKITVAQSKVEQIKDDDEFILRDDQIESRIRTVSVLMIIPFAVAAAWESIFSLRKKKKKDTERASTVGMICMVIGFGTVVLGLGIILYHLLL